MSNKYLNAISSLDNNVFIDIEVSPNSNKFQISGFNEWRNRFEIRIKQVPQKGKANKENLKYLIVMLVFQKVRNLLKKQLSVIMSVLIVYWKN